ncbi:hypothetical protein GCM10018772_45530 [Streptomyces fumanus]|uniref:Uncharacterized protein n=1 Tax=Streptomyces fumanus TaxID=67302 RepID=A0A919ANC6_9ACTN|nr:hypothetical protein GCM10018772_45530 [Streptomyces fumanus]
MPVLLSTAQAVPGTSAFSTELLTLLSSAELKVLGVSDAFALGTAIAAAATRPVDTASNRVRLVIPLRGVVRLILTFRSSTGEVGGLLVGSWAREAQPEARTSGFRNTACP